MRPSQTERFHPPPRLRGRLLFVPRWSFSHSPLVQLVLVVLLLAFGHSARGQSSILIRSLAFERGWVTLNWEGGQPPYRVQVYTEGLGRWLDLSDFIFGGRFDCPTFGDAALFRVRSAEDNQAPAPPGDLKLVAARCHTAALSWLATEDDDAGSGLRAYHLYRNGSLLAELPADETFFLDRTAEPETQYDYTVTAVDRVGNESAASPSVTVTTPTCVAASGSTSEIRLVWDGSEDSRVSGYVVHWGVRPGEYLWATDNLDSTSITIGGLEPCTAYFFAVRAYDDEGESGYSQEIAHITPEVSQISP